MLCAAESGAISVYNIIIINKYFNDLDTLTCIKCHVRSYIAICGYLHHQLSQSLRNSTCYVYGSGVARISAVVGPKQWLYCGL